MMLILIVLIMRVVFGRSRRLGMCDLGGYILLSGRVLRRRVLGARVLCARSLRARIHVEARLQPAEGLKTRIRFLNRHAPTWRPPRHRCRHASAARRSRRIGPLASIDHSPAKKIDRNAVPPIISITTDPEKGTKGRHIHGDRADRGGEGPGFQAAPRRRGTISLADFKGRKLVIYAYPRADTPGCTRESIDFSKLRAEFQKADTEILGVSADPVEAQDKFKKKHKLGLALLSDETHKMLETYGAWGKKSMYGKTFMGVIRATFLVDAQGRIARIWPKVKVDGHAAEVLAAAKELQAIHD